MSHYTRTTKILVWRGTALLVSVAALGGCCTTPRSEAAIDISAVSAVQTEIKRQVTAYLVQQEKDVKTTTAQVPVRNQCGRGDLDFRLTKITTTLITKVSGNAGMSGTFPIPTAAYTRNNDQTLVFNQLVLPSYYQDPEIYDSKNEPSMEKAPIAAVLTSLREGLIKASVPLVSKESPGPVACLTSYAANPADMAGTFEIAIAVKKEVGLPLQIFIGPLKYGPSFGGSILESSTIKATFEPYYTDSLKIALTSPKPECPDAKKANTISCRADNGKIAWCTGCEDLIPKEKVVTTAQGGGAKPPIGLPTK